MHKTRNDFPGALYLCAGGVQCGEYGHLESFTPDLLKYWSGRIRDYDGRLKKVIPGGWYCDKCIRFLLQDHFNLEQHSKGKKLSINKRDLGPTLEERLKKQKFPQRTRMERQIEELKARIRDLEDLVGGALT